MEPEAIRGGREHPETSAAAFTWTSQSAYGPTAWKQETITILSEAME